MNPPLPTLFVPHGAPTFALRPGAAGAALRQLAASLPTPRAIVVISPHWDTATPIVGTAAKPQTIHDFWGFPEQLYTLSYPASGSPSAASEVCAALSVAGLKVSEDKGRGLDHGAWVPLRLMFPEADVPVVPLSLQSQGGPAQALRLGQALAGLSAKGFLVIGSGSLTHNLTDYQVASAHGGLTPAYVREFADWLAVRVTANDLPALLDYRRQAPAAARAHPSEEHLLPLFVALGAAGTAARGARIFAGIDDYVIAMDAYAFTPATLH